ncbi:hypothetical protein F5883DRAFT_584214 [Diaporthe sp. PMI_573]|nr:hypothetical protein F5883DRAFT_584214 [Diaporthaceae sp. PMI_573]
MVTTRFQKTLEAKREANAKCLLYSLPQELLLIICQFLGLSLDKKIIHLFLRRQPALCETTHPDRCTRGRHFPKRTRRHISRCLTTVWHLMQASWYLRNFAQPLYMAHIVHLICVHPTSKKRIDIDIHHGKYISRRLRHFGDNLCCLIRLRHEVWMRSLLRHVKDLSLDRRGDIRLIPDPRYFTAQPELQDLMIELAQLRLHSRAGLYILLLPRRNDKYKNEKTNTQLSIHKKAMENLRNRYWKKGAQLGQIQKVLYRQETDKNYEFDVFPTKEFIASGCDLWEVGIGVGWLKRYAQEAVWLRIFPAIGEDVEEDGFEWRECGEKEDRDWWPTSMENGKGSEEDDSEDSDADDVVDWKREKRERINGIGERHAWKGEVGFGAATGNLKQG